MKYLLVANVAVIVLSGCSIKMHGRLTCEGPCELVIDREVKELDPIPLPPLPKDKEK